MQNAPLWFQALVQDSSPTIFAAMAPGTGQGEVTLERILISKGNVLVAVPNPQSITALHKALEGHGARLIRSKSDLFTAVLSGRQITITTWEALGHSHTDRTWRGRTFTDVIALDVWSANPRDWRSLMAVVNRTEHLLLIGTPPGDGKALAHPATEMYWRKDVQQYQVRSMDWPGFDTRIAADLIQRLGPTAALAGLLAEVPKAPI